MLESFNSDPNELCATNQDLRTYIDIIKKERAANPDQNTLHFENVAHITTSSDSIIQ